MKVLLTDIGGVLLTNGWDSNSRKLAAAHFNLDPKEMDNRHRQMYDTYECGKIPLKGYLDQVVFYEKRSFSQADFYRFMQEQSQPYHDVLALYKEIRKQGIRIGAISNEGQDLGAYRVQTFGLDEFIDFFVISGFVGMRKPDPAIFQLALDIAQVKKEEVLYIDDRQILVTIAETYGIPSYHHTTAQETRAFIEKQ